MRQSHAFTALSKRWLLALLVWALIAIPASALAQSDQSVIIYLFWGDGCPHCEAAKPALRDLAQRYSVELREYEVWYNAENQAAMSKMAAALGFEPQYVPTIFLADRHWEGYSEEIIAEIESTVAACLQTTCPDAAAGVVLPVAGYSQRPPESVAEMQSDGFILAVIVMVGMVAVLFYAFAYVQSGLQRRKSRRAVIAPAPDKWRQVGMLVLCLVGLGVAGYLAYVETQAVPAVCGPVGDCNAVQSSPYARLFGVLPVGVLGVIGYLAILAAWFYPRLRRDRYSAYMPAAILVMAFFGVLFSLYLTFLEPFIIQAVCMWCITSAVIMTLLLLLSLKPALRSIQAIRR